MDGCKIRTMAGVAVATGSKGLAGCQADQAAIGIMTGGAGVMHLGIRCIGQGGRITVAAGTACRPCYGYYRCMGSRQISRSCMDGCKIRSVAGVAVATGSKRLTNRKAFQGTIYIMTGGAGVMHLGIRRIYQGAGMAAGT
jgi:hypothetical protein